jgi:hypothetical protein
LAMLPPGTALRIVSSNSAIAIVPFVSSCTSPCPDQACRRPVIVL